MENTAAGRTQLLRETSHLALNVLAAIDLKRGIDLEAAIRLVVPVAVPPFDTPAQVARRYAFATTNAVKNALDEFADHLGLSDPNSIAELASQRIHTFKLSEFRQRLSWIKPSQGEDSLGTAAKKFFAAEVLFELLAQPFDLDVSYPQMVNRVFSDAALGLFEVGRVQFDKLADVICDTADWIGRNSFQRVAIIESPLGNTLPSQVLHDVLTSQGAACVIEEWGCPRNEAPSRGLTIKASAIELAQRSNVQGADCVVFMDDILTGTRLSKMARALRSVIPAERVAVIGMRCRYPKEAGASEFPPKDLDALNRWAGDPGRPYGVADFPPLPLFNVDDEGRVYLEKALCWGDVDIVAGKRKANLVFNIIDHYEHIAKSLTAKDSIYWAALDELWSEDASGLHHIILPGLVRMVVGGVIHRVGVKWLFKEIRSAAIAAFPNDYVGQTFPPTEAQVRARSDWLGNCISTAAKQKVSESKAEMLSLAIRSLHQSRPSGMPTGPDRDHAYANYTLPWNSSIQCLNRRLREQVVGLVSVRCAAQKMEGTKPAS